MYSRQFRKTVLLGLICKWQQNTLNLPLDNDCSIRVYQLFVQNISYYAGIMLNAFNHLLCSKLCWHNRLVPTSPFLHDGCFCFAYIRYSSFLSGHSRALNTWSFLGLYIGVHDKRQDLIYLDHFSMKSHDNIYSQAFTTRQWSLESTKRTTRFTREYLLLVGYYLRVESVRRKLLASIFNSLVIIREQYFSRCTSPTSELNAKFLEARIVTLAFCKLGCELYWLHVVVAMAIKLTSPWSQKLVCTIAP